MSVCFEATWACPHIDARNEFQILKSCLIRCNSIKVLHVYLEDIDKGRCWKSIPSLGYESWEDGPFNFHWQDGDCFPALEDWCWSGRT
jgi:hypothetical protein